MSYIDACELVIRMTKSEGGLLPDVSNLKASEIKKRLKLSVDYDTLKSFGYTHYRVIKGGEKSDSITITDGKLEGYPTLKVRIYAYPSMSQVKVSIFGDDATIVSACFSYLVESDDDDFFFIDANGYTSTSRVTSEMVSPEVFDQKIRNKSIEL